MIHTIQFPKYVRDEQPIHQFTNARGAESNGIRKRFFCGKKKTKKRNGRDPSDAGILFSLFESAGKDRSDATPIKRSTRNYRHSVWLIHYPIRFHRHRYTLLFRPNEGRCHISTPSPGSEGRDTFAAGFLGKTSFEDF
ncbi:hypothetical protein CDAR_497391 [Caerostris darwini]|uniref:Uncharacterized protein n=1 Tax=Caerostris darwini TaxID=1538125 RepID=A0AAV4S4U7_9ARAC|nr:hypothetical protein CDAR_497391 [Caerostris darwini]